LRRKGQVNGYKAKGGARDRCGQKEIIEKKRAGKWLQSIKGDRDLSGQKEMIIEKKRAGKWL